MTIQAIETSYNGYRFRSRLEARWAVFFDTAGIRYEYEKQGYDLPSFSFENEFGYKSILIGTRYLPDFHLPDNNVWIEIKGDECSNSDKSKVELFHRVANEAIYIAQGSIGDHDWVFVDSDDADGWGRFAVSVSTNTVKVRTLFDPHENDTLSHSNWGDRVHCPVCGQPYVHIRSTEYCPSGDSWGVAWVGRGDAIFVRMSCEMGHDWTIRFGFHKGATFTSIEDIVIRTNNVGLWLCGGDKDRYNAAITDARSARFEHGETPKVQRGKQSR